MFPGNPVHSKSPNMPHFRLVSFLWIICCIPLTVWADIPRLRIPKVVRPPQLEDFLNGTPREAETVITDFRQYDPKDGVAITQPTTAFLSYDERIFTSVGSARTIQHKSAQT